MDHGPSEITGISDDQRQSAITGQLYQNIMTRLPFSFFVILNACIPVLECLNQGE